MKREAFALALAMLLPSAMAYGYFVALRPEATGQVNSALQLAYPTAKVIQFSLPAVFLIVFGKARSDPKPSNIVKISRGGLRIGMTFGLAVGVMIIVLAEHWRDTLLVGVADRVATKVGEFGAGTPIRYLGLAIFLSGFHSLMEEYYWRWFVHARLRQYLAFAPAALLSGVAFAGHHIFVLDFYLPGRFWSAAVPFTLAIAVGGMFWAWLYERTGSLAGPWISHMIVDAAIMAVGYKMVFLQ